MFRRGIYTSLVFGISVICFTVFMGSLGVAVIDSTSVEQVIPGDALVYLKLQNLQACREAVKNSENWKEAVALITGLPQWASVEQFINMMPMFLGTDFQTVIDTFLADEVGVMVSLGAGGPMVGVVIKNSGKHQAAEDIFVRLVKSTDGVDGNEVSLTEGSYRGIKYYKLHANEGAFTYGNLNKDLFLIGIMDGSFKKMVDVYMTENTSIAGNTTYRSAMDQFGGSEIFGFVNMEMALPFTKMLFPPAIGNELASVQTLVYSWDLLHKGGSQKIYTQLKEGRNKAFISRLEEKTEIRSMQGLSGQEGFSLAVAPSSAHTLLQMLILSKLASESHTNDSPYGFLISDKTDIASALTGDITLSVDASTFHTFNESGLNFRTESTDEVVKSIELEFGAINLGFIFNPDSPLKWQAFFDSIVDKMTTDPVEEYAYKGMTFNIVTIPGKLYYGTVNDLFVAALSEQHFQSIIGNVLASKNSPSLEEATAIHPAGLIQFNLHEFLSYADSTGEISWLSKDALTLRKKIESLLVSLAAKGDEMWLEIQLSKDEKPIETVALLAPVVFIGLTKDMIQIR